MHKLKKGLKKKIKGKDHKGKGEDLFDPEQLAKFKKELEAQKELEAATAAVQCEDNTETVTQELGFSSSGVTDKGEEDEEWQRFNLLTAGVDSILKKTSGDLDRIKSSSYFQRTKPTTATSVKSTPQRPPPVPTEYLSKHQPQHHCGSHWVDCDSDKAFGESEDDQAEHEDKFEDVHTKVAQEEINEKLRSDEELEPEEESIVLADELFDTSFVDAIASGEIKLAFIPDSPPEPDGDDPFDTSAADAVVKIIEEKAWKDKKRVNLEFAVEVLEKGQFEKDEPTSESNSKGQKRGHRRPQNINLLGSFDEEGIFEQTIQTTVPALENLESHVVHDVFDELSPNRGSLHSSQQLSDVILPVHLVTSSVQLQPLTKSKFQTKEVSVSNNLKDILSEFESFELEPQIITQNVPLVSEDQDSFLHDEFADLAAESLHKTEHLTLSKPERPKRPALPANPIHKKTSEVATVQKNEVEPDPFDTSFVEGISYKGSTIKVTEDHIIFDEDSKDYFVPKVSIENQASVSIVDYVDPFDTSTVANLQPGKFELKLLEEELLSSKSNDSVKGVGQETDVDDFDPRKDEIQIVEPQPHPLDSIIESESSTHVTLKTLTPEIEASVTPLESDPFDTSDVSISQAVLPGKVELKILEKEFAPRSSTNETLGLDEEFDFNPRHGEPEQSIPFVIEKTVQDIFEGEFHFSSEKLLTPLTAADENSIINFQGRDIEDDGDPFDTSCIVVKNFCCGKVELKNLEAELLESTTDVQPPPRPPLPINIIDSVVKRTATTNVTTPSQTQPSTFEFDSEDYDNSFSDHIAPLQPLSPSKLLLANSHDAYSGTFVDPFDTTIAGSVIPGKIEIQLLETELGVQAGVRRTYSDPNFNPRESLHASIGLTHLPLLPQTETDSLEVKTSSCEVDPFDTSVVDSLVLGKSEIKLLEEELL